LFSILKEYAEQFVLKARLILYFGFLIKELPLYAGNKIGTYYRSNDNYQYELTDNLGNIRVVINKNKAISGQADVAYYSDYLPFGTQITLSNNDYRFGYQGQYSEFDKETGWNNFELRMYDPAIGRWMSVDPKGQYWSPYLAMGDNPILLVDPDGGLDGCPECPAGENKFKVLKNGTFEGNLKEVKIIKPSYVSGPYAYAFSNFNHAEAGAGLYRAGFNVDKEYYAASGYLNGFYAKAYAKEGMVPLTMVLRQGFYMQD
jgi:RHS repeat-associated protein